jgi:acetoin utilization deacetylase AcuC-like enzyme
LNWQEKPMAGNHDVAVFYDDRMLDHYPDVSTKFLRGRLDRRIREIISEIDADWKYPEHPGRLTAILELLEEYPIEGVRLMPGARATREQLSRVHTTNHLDALEDLRGENAWLDVDTTAVSKGSVDAAEYAAGTSIKAVEAVVKGEAKNAFALVRPPGHHAEPARARGFCLVNNVAVAAAHAQSVLGCKRVLILDWDAHHGNGTQDIFWADPDVMFFDIHRSAPFYPGSGQLDEVGAGLGEGTTINIPVPAGAGDVAYINAMRDILAPAADFFKPDLILVSAGFDAHWLDLALNVSYEGFAAMTGIVQEIAQKHCNGRLAFILEGGYNLESLSKGVHAVLRTLAGEETPEPGACGVAEVAEAAEFHLSAFSYVDEDEIEEKGDEKG